jgi:CRP/FNR family transcriptional regulator, cyclic AMP receptor protein
MHSPKPFDTKTLLTATTDGGHATIEAPVVATSTNKLCTSTNKLEKHKLLPSLPEHLSARVFGAATQCQLKEGEPLFMAGDAGDGCYRLERGLLKVVATSAHGDERILALLGPSEVVCELAIIDGRPRSASVFAVSDCKLSFISRKNFEQCLRQHPEICGYLLSVLASRLRETDEALAAASFLTVKARLARALLELAELLGEEHGSGRILIRLRRNDLAAMAGVAPESVSRVINDWMKRKVVTRSSGYYCLEDIATLKSQARS